MEKLLFKPIIVSIDDMDKFPQTEMKKIRPIKNTWYDWLINYIHLNEPCMGKERGKETKNTKNQKSFYITKEKQETKDTITRDILTLFETEKIEKERKK